MNPAQAREAIQAGNVTWGEARVGYDRPAFERMLAPTFFVRLPDRTLTRAEFIDLISGHPPETRLVRFDATVLTVEADRDGWVAVILERIEREMVVDGAPTKECMLVVTRDGWRNEEGRWTILFTELLGQERWPGGALPPAREW